MPIIKRNLSKTFKNFFDSEKSSGVLLIVCTAVSLAVTNSAAGEGYTGLWHTYVGGLSIEHWINDALMAVFFLLIGLELERELYVGELSDFRNALLPIVAALGGIAAPALIHFALNAGTPTQAGVGIPMATDIAFALGVLALLGSRVPASLKVFLTALAVMDDLGAIIVIAVFYVAVLWGFMGSRGPAEVLLPQAYFVLGGTLAFLLTLFHPPLRSLERLFSGGGPSPYPQGRRDGINLGALLMFVGALKVMLLTSGMHPGSERGLTALAFVAGMLLLTLLLRPVLRAAHGLLFITLTQP